MHAHRLVLFHFISKAWDGRVSDIDIVKDFDLINPNLHHHGDQILSDCGFILQDEFAAGCGVEVIIPSFAKRKTRLSTKQLVVS